MNQLLQWINQSLPTDSSLLWVISLALLGVGFLVFIIFGGLFHWKGASGFFSILFFISAWLCLFSSYYYSTGGSDIDHIRGSFWESILAALQHAMRLFVVDGDFRLYTIDVETLPMARGYVLLGAVYYALAPLFTFTFLLTFFKNLKARLFYFVARTFGRRLHIFSELNESTVALAKSLRKGPLHWNTIIFTDVTDKKEEENMELIEKARSMGAILFRRDLEGLNHGKLLPLKRTFYLISEDEAEKLRHARHIIKKYDRKRTTLYLFSDSVSTKAFIKSLSPRNVPQTEKRKEKKLKIIRINDIRFLVYNELDKNGLEMLKNANPVDGKRVISAVIVGLGRYGREMLKALLWYCQLPGYELHVNAFDEDPNAKSHILTFCPGNKLCAEGDMRYNIEVHTVRTGTKAFEDALANVVTKERMTYGFVCLGDDEMNLTVATDLCRIAGRESCYPTVKAIVYNSDLTKHLPKPDSDDPQQKKNRPHIIGDIESFYDQKTVLNSELIELARNIHTSWNTTIGSDAEKTFYRNDYCFFSSLSKALHRRLRQRILKLDDKETAEYFPAFVKTMPDGTVNPIREAMEYVRDEFVYTKSRRKKMTVAAKFAKDMTFGSQMIHLWLAKHIYLYKQKDENDKQGMTSAQRELAWKKLAVLVKETDRKENEKVLNDLLQRRTTEGDRFWTDPAFFPCNKKTKAQELTIFTLLFDACCQALGRDNCVADRAENMRKWSYGGLTDDEKEQLAKDLTPLLKDPKTQSGYIPDRIVSLCHNTAKVEHVRWMSYMLTEGYVQTDELDMKRKFDQHITLVPTDELTLADWVKDT